ncbi:MAG: YfiR family protein [Phycisphaerales bacterium]
MASRLGRPSLLVLGATLILSSHAAPALAEETVDREYRIKAAFVFNFLKFVEGGRFALSQDKKKDEQDPNDALLIGILGVPPSRLAFEEFKGKKVGTRPLQVRWFRGLAELADEDGNTPEQHPDLEKIRKCHVLFICPSERAFLPQILSSVRDDGILTVADVPPFLETGGVINLLIEDKKVRFEINLAAAARAHLVIRSSLLRLAARTVEHDRLEAREGQEKAGGSSHP